MSERTGSTIVSRMICGVCMKDIYYRVDTEKRLNLTGCGCGERASAIDAPPFQPQPSFIQVTKVCPSCAAKDARIKELEARCDEYHLQLIEEENKNAALEKVAEAAEELLATEDERFIMPQQPNMEGGKTFTAESMAWTEAHFKRIADAKSKLRAALDKLKEG